LRAAAVPACDVFLRGIVRYVLSANGCCRPPVTNPNAINLLTTTGFTDYALLDSGYGRKLERFGRFVFDRPEPQAMWRQRLEPSAWLRSDAAFKTSDEEGEAGRWQHAKPLPPSWPLKVLGATVQCRLTSFRHLGLFPEQLPHWQWMLERIAAVAGERPRVLNLFAYTGAASLIAARAGAEVTHVDASRRAIAWAKENQQASSLADAPVRWILDDARKFAAREVRRGRTYHVVLIDPPKYGRGPDGEVWDFFTHMPALMRDCAALLAPATASLVLTSYAIRASSLAIDGLVREALEGRTGDFETGELALLEEAGQRLLPTSLYTRWLTP
jgi:23S rRNA (cytosine1962-C5)-methyltransferase